MQVVDSAGKLVVLGPEVGRGGEGAVYEIATSPTLVAKLYHKSLDSSRAAKIGAMTLSANADVLKFAAWPLSVLRSNGSIVGLLMRKVGRSDEPIHELYTPKSRLRKFPTAHWDFLIHVASNVARGFAAIHTAGHVIGDVNHGNILVSSAGTASFIDCDSFQIQANGTIFRCLVGVPPYTPPELQGQPFGAVVRTKNHDAFGLAVLIFHLLFMGRHPFVGRFFGKGDMPVERAITEYRFPYGRRAEQIQMKPPPGSLLLNQIPSRLSEYFEKAFSQESARDGSRPTPMDWLSALGELQRNLKRCTHRQVHVHAAVVSVCPWCPIETQGIILFIDTGKTTFESGFNIDQLWRALEILPPLGGLVGIPTPQNVAFTTSVPDDIQRRGRSRRIRIGTGIGAVIIAVALAAGLRLDSPYSFAIIVASIVFAFVLPKKLNTQRDAILPAIQQWERRYQELQNRYAADCSEQPFILKCHSLESTRTEWKGLPLLRQRKLQDLEKNKRALQLNQFLDNFSIRPARIPKVGDGRKQVLISWGVDTAADVTWQKLESVPGIGPKIARSIMEWRMRLENKFTFDPHKGIDRMEIEKIDRELQQTQSQLDQRLRTGIREAVAMHSLIATRRKTYLDQLDQAVRQLMQLKANHKAS
jgi:DNA-binding helix-hairpin-helix protein with protein kinase domain